MDQETPHYITLEPVYPNSFDPNQYRERNNASWDRIRHENAASVRSEPPNYMFIDIEAEPIPGSHSHPHSHPHILNHDQSKHIEIEVEDEEEELDDDGQFEIEEGSIVDSEIMENMDIYPDAEHSRDGDSMENEEPKVDELPDIYCMECDTLIDANITEKHTLEVCDRNKPKKLFKCPDCPAEFNFEINNKVHQIVKHMKINQFASGQSCSFCPESNKTSFLRFSAFVGHVQQHSQPDHFSCRICSEEVEDQVSLKKHIRHEHAVPNELLYCPRCEDVLAMEEKISHLLLHVTHKNITDKSRRKTIKRVAEKDKKHKCLECGKLFARSIDLKRHDDVHKREHFSIPKWKCAICNKEYAHQSGLYEHKRITHGNTKKKIICTICGLEFVKNSNLSRHVKNIHPLNIDPKDGKERFQCEDCPSVLTSQGSLTQHKKRVHNIHDEIVKKPILAFDKHNCEICNREFREVSMLERHRKMHLMVDKRVRSVLKEQKCEYCEKRFLFPASLVWHRQTHFEEGNAKNKDNPVTCTACDIDFPTQQSFKNHVERIHSIGCGNCQEKFVSREMYANHNCVANMARRPMMITGNPSGGTVYQPSNRVVLCRLCKPPQRLVTLRQINEHRAKHQPRKVHLCWTCHKSFRTAQLLSLHRMVHNSQPLPCPQCRIVFRSRVVLKQHIRSVHSNENNYQCVVHTDRNAAMSVQSFAEYGMQNEASGATARAHSVDDWMEQQPYEEPVEEVPVQFPDGNVRCDVCKHLYHNMERLCEHWQENETEQTHSFSIISCPVCQISVRGNEAALHLRMKHLDARPRHLSFVGTVDNYQNGPAPKQPTHTAQQKKVHECTECQRTFKKKCDLTRHIRTHTGERPFKCPQCPMAFSVKSTMNTHMNIHANLPATHECGVCQKRFFDRRALVVHMRLHTGETPIKCKYCDECFRTSLLAKRHEKQCLVKNDKYFNPHLPSTSRIATDSYPRDVEISQTIRQISTMPQKQLKMSHTSAFNAVQTPINSNNFGSTYIITKPVTMTDFVVVVQSKAPPKSEIREAIDTVSCVGFDQLRGTEISIVLHNNMRLVANCGKFIQLVSQSHGAVVKEKIRVGNSFPTNSPFTIIQYEEVFNKRCDICEIDFTTKDQSDEHFYSEDHETAQLMFPREHLPQNQMTNHSPAANNEYPMTNHDNNMFNCKVCGKRFLDLELLIAHINKEHDRDGATVIPPRPAAHTAPIH